MKIFTSFLASGLMLFCVNAHAAETSASTPKPTKISAYTQMVLNGFTKEISTRSTSDRKKTDPELFLHKDGVFYLKSFIRYKDKAAIEVLENNGVIFQTHHKGEEGLSTCLIPKAKIEEIAKLDCVIGIEGAQKIYTRLDSVRRCSNINAIHQGLAPLSQPYKGQGVIVGVVDEGFDFTHPNYYDASGTTYRVQKLWSQVTTASGSQQPPSGYSQGVELTTPATIQALETDNTNETHGTHTSGIAAGSGYTTPYTGIAPESNILLVATDMTSTGITDGVAYIFDQADATPCVVNLSLGSEIGPHDGTSATDIFMSKLIGPGKIIVGAAGNSGSDAIHLQKEFTGASGQSIQSVISPSQGVSAALTDIWSRNNNSFNVQISIYNNGQLVDKTNSYAASSQSTSVSLNGASGQTYSIGFYNQLYTGNNCYNTLVQIQPEYGQFSSSDVFVLTISEGNGIVNAWATNATFINNGNSAYTAGDTNYTVGEVGGVGAEVISVGAYATKISWEPVGGGVESYVDNPTLYDIASFSSKGPTADERPKPDITAPGFGVVSGFNSFCTTIQSGTTVINETFNNKSYSWGIDQGTSMASPVIAGTVALLLEANPNLSPADIKTIFSQTAFNPTAQRSISQSNTWGYGKLDGLAAVSQAVALSVKPVMEDLGNVNISILPNPNKGQFRISMQTPFQKITLCDLTGRSILSKQLNEATCEYDVRLDRMIPGVYMLQLVTETGKVTTKVIID